MERTEETFWKELNKRISEAKEGDIIIADEPTYLSGMADVTISINQIMRR